MGYLAYYLVLAGIICLIMKAEWMIPLRKYLMTAFLTAGLFLHQSPCGNRMPLH